MPYTISKDFGFSASHQLYDLPAGHQCARLHGHNYLVRVTVSSPSLDKTGFVFDYGELAPFGLWIDEHLDHRHLNDVPGLGAVNPTAENLAELLYRVLTGQPGFPALLVPRMEGLAAQVGVSETPKTWAWFRP